MVRPCSSTTRRSACRMVEIRLEVLAATGPVRQAGRLAPRIFAHHSSATAAGQVRTAGARRKPVGELTKESPTVTRSRFPSLLVASLLACAAVTTGVQAGSFEQASAANGR